MSCHEAIFSELHVGPLYPLSREQLLSPDAPPGMTALYRHLDEARVMLLSPIFQSHDGLQYRRRIMRDWNAQNIEANLQAVFAETASTIPLDMLANYLAGAQIALVH